MSGPSRREFLNQVGTGMLAAGLGPALAAEFGARTAFADEGSATIPLGEHARLVDLLRATPTDKIQPILAKMVLAGDVSLPKLMAAGALANAVAFGGCDYVGFHTAMAMLPALEMSKLMPSARQPLPILMVLHQNSRQIQKVGGATASALPVQRAEAAFAAKADVGVAIRDACRATDVGRAESLLASVGDEPMDLFHALQPTVQDDMNVHRFVFAHRTHGLVGLLGREYAYSLLRQCVRFASHHEKERIRHGNAASPIRALLPKLMDKYRLAGIKPGRRDPGDDAVARLSETIYGGTREQAAEAAAAALADGIDPEVVGEAISLAANAYVLRQGPDKPRAHGDAAGVHASDASNAWRSMARVLEPTQAAAGLIVAAYHVGVQSPPFKTPAYPWPEHLAEVKTTEPARLLAITEDAIRHNNQPLAAAAMQVFGDKGYPLADALALLLRYTVSEDGRLHGEKYFQTVREEYQTTRPAFRWRQIVGLARVTASAYGYNRDDQHGFRAAGYEEACKLLGVEA